MKICCISDTHGKHHQLDLTQYNADVLLHAGDFTKHTSKSDVVSFIEWFSEQPFKYKIFIAGNHEVQVEDHEEWFKEFISGYPDITYLQDSETVIEGIKFYGSPASNRFGSWAFMDDEEGLEKVWAKIPNDTHVLITHGPAYKVHDKVNNTWSVPNVGSQSLTERRSQLTDLQVHISGHIHEAYGVSYTGDITNVCPCILNERYHFVNKPIVVEI